MTIYTAQRKLGQMIIDLRAQVKIGVKELAYRSGVAKKKILHIQTGVKTFSRETIKSIIAALKVTDEAVLQKIAECINVIYPPRRLVFRSALA